MESSLVLYIVLASASIGILYALYCRIKDFKTNIFKDTLFIRYDPYFKVISEISQYVMGKKIPAEPRTRIITLDIHPTEKRNDLGSPLWIWDILMGEKDGIGIKFVIKKKDLLSKTELEKLLKELGFVCERDEIRLASLFSNLCESIVKERRHKPITQQGYELQRALRKRGFSTILHFT